MKEIKKLVSTYQEIGGRASNQLPEQRRRHMPLHRVFYKSRNHPERSFSASTYNIEKYALRCCDTAADKLAAKAQGSSLDYITLL